MKSLFFLCNGRHPLPLSNTACPGRFMNLSRNSTMAHNYKVVKCVLDWCEDINCTENFFNIHLFHQGYDPIFTSKSEIYFFDSNAISCSNATACAIHWWYLMVPIGYKDSHHTAPSQSGRIKFLPNAMWFDGWTTARNWIWHSHHLAGSCVCKWFDWRYL